MTAISFFMKPSKGSSSLKSESFLFEFKSHSSASILFENSKKILVVFVLPFSPELLKIQLSAKRFEARKMNVMIKIFSLMEVVEYSNP